VNLSAGAPSKSQAVKVKLQLPIPQLQGDRYLATCQTQQNNDLCHHFEKVKTLQPQSADFLDPFVLKKVPNIHKPASSPFLEALEMYSEEADSHISVKNENLPTLKACRLDFLKNLVYLNLSMNKIAIIDGGFECANLRTLILSDNQIKEITPKAFQKLPQLRELNLDINNISKLENL